MSDKNIPVFITRADNQRVQIGVASEVDPETNARSLDIWPQFDDVGLANLEFGEPQEPVDIAPDANRVDFEIASEVADKGPEQVDPEPAEGAEAEPVQAPREQFRKDNNRS